MSSSSASCSASSQKMKSFVSEADLEERRRKRQEEWEKVRTADQPLEAPEEEYDSRSLYERLEEQKQRKQADYEESHKLKNMIRGLDDDEVTFLELVDQQKAAMETAVLKEEKQVLDEFKRAVCDLSEKELELKRQEVKKLVQNSGGSASVISPPKRGQAALLSSAVKRKSDATKPSGVSEPKKEKVETTSTNDTTVSSSEKEAGETKNGAFQILGVLPGVGDYTDSSDSECSNASMDENHRNEFMFDEITPSMTFFARAIRLQRDMQKNQDGDASKVAQRT